MSFNDLKSYFLALKQLTRPLAYKFVFILMPFFSLLVVDNFILSPLFLIALIVPFFLIHAAGFTYNQICDRSIDPVSKNPLTRGAISCKMAGFFLLGFLLTAVFSFLLFYTSAVAILLFAIYVTLWFSYSGLGVRFKETTLGVFVASFVLWTATPLILLAQFNYFSITTISLLFFIFLTYAGQEVLHTLHDYENDTEKNCKTFTARVGKIKAMIIMHLLILTGYLFILFNSVYSKNPILLSLSILYGAGYFIVLAVQVISFRRNHNYSFIWVSGRWPFLLAGLYLLVLSIIFLELSPLVTLLLILTFLSFQYYRWKFV